MADRWTTKFRHLAAVDAIEEGIGRCAETGKPLHFSTGMGSGSLDKIEVGPQIMAGLSVFSHITRLCAQRGVRIICSVGQPDTMPILEEFIRDSFRAEGVTPPDMEDALRFHTTDQGAFSSAYVSIMRREKPACDIFIGPIWKESATCIAASRQAGAMTIFGTARFAHMTWLSSFADYLLIGEEIYAAAAHLTNDREMLNSIAMQDIIKIFSILLILLGALLSFISPTNNIILNILGA
jgi:hypothetical protein